jgi:endonuclease III
MAQKPSTPSQAESARAQQIVAELYRLYPDAKCSLDFTTPLELLVATILSAQCTDSLVNSVTPALFKKYRAAADYGAAPLEELEQDVRKTGFYRNKAKSLQNTGRLLVERFDGAVPRTMEELTTLPGVARKTANVVMGNAYGVVEGVVVDTHVGRLSRRMGLTTSEDPVRVEQDLMALLPQKDWLPLSHMMIYHGRAICQARRPLCEKCTLVALCPTGQQTLASNGPAEVAQPVKKTRAAKA